MWIQVFPASVTATSTIPQDRYGNSKSVEMKPALRLIVANTEALHTKCNRVFGGTYLVKITDAMGENGQQ